MANDHNPEDGPIEEESSVVEQSIVEATIILQEVIDEYPHSIDIEDLKEIMSHLEDAHTALDTEALPTGDEDKMWCNFLIPEMSKLNCGHHPQRAYRLGDGDLVGECLKCNYSAVQNIHSDDEFKAEADAERQADALLELQAEACYGDDLDGGWY